MTTTRARLRDTLRAAMGTGGEIGAGGTTGSGAKAFSYLRFSTPEQAHGDSFRRQHEAAREWASKHGLALDESLRFEDLGVSAFASRNVERGALRAFLQACEQGVVPRGSFLLVESLDRVSRDQIIEAQAAFLSIIGAGVTLVTLADGKTFNRESVNANPMDLMWSILILMRAHEESATKGRRVRAAWEQKKREARNGTPMTSSTPAWVALRDRKLVLVEERAAVVKRVYAMAAEGAGDRTIAETLNAEKVPTFRGAAFWRHSYIRKILDSRAAEGIYVPHSHQRTAAGKQRVPQVEDSVPDYYPRCVPEEIAAEVRALREGKAARRGRHTKRELVNPLAGLAKCPACGSTVTLINKSAGLRYYKCVNWRQCGGKAVPFRIVELALGMQGTRLADEAPRDDGDATAALARALRMNDDATNNITTSIEGLLEDLDRTRDAAARQALVKRIADRERALADLQRDERRLRDQLAGAVTGAVAARLEKLREAMSGTDVEAANVAMRAAFASVTIDRHRNRIGFAWRHAPGETTEIALDPFQGEER
jgi:DNA invertase Pin-like site-specific DNA recombinase